MSIFKVFLMLGLMMYTFITMVGGNPDNDAYGFRYWRDPVRTPCSVIGQAGSNFLRNRAHSSNTSSPATQAASSGYYPA